MQIQTVQQESYVLMQVSGRIHEPHDGDALMAETDRLVESGVKYIAIRFTDLSYIYSGIIKIIVNLHQKLDDAGGTLGLLESQEQLFDVLDVLGLTRILKAFKSEQDFVSYIGS